MANQENPVSPELNTGVIPENPFLGGVINPNMVNTNFSFPGTNIPSNSGNPATQSQLTPDLQALALKTNALGKHFDETVKNAPVLAYDKFAYSIKRSYSPDEMEFERYSSHPAFNKLGFSPFRDNETYYNSNTSGISDFVRASKHMPALAMTGAWSMLKSWKDLATGDFLKQDTESAQAMEESMKNYGSRRGGFSGFTSNMFLNFGYTAGIMGEIAVEEVLLALAAPETGGASVPEMGIRAVKGGTKIFEGFKVMSKSMNALKNLGRIEDAKSFWRASNMGEGMARFLLPNTTELFMKSKGIGDFAKSSKTFGGFYRDIREMNATLSEAKMEGGGVRNDLEKTLSDEYYAKHGYMPDGKDLQAIKQAADDAGAATLIANIPGIFLTNKLMFDNLFKGYRPAKEFMAPGGKFVLNSAISKTGKTIASEAPEAFKYVESSLKNSFKALAKPGTYGKAAWNYFKGNLAEGLQETTQDIISESARDYYTDIYNNPAKQGNDNLTGILLSNIGDQFSKKGVETFAGGFLMGMLAKPFNKVPQWVSTGYTKVFDKENYNKYKTEKEEYIKKTTEKLNEFYKDPVKFFDARAMSLANQSSSVKGMADAQKNNDEKSYLDHKDSNLYDHILTALNTGTFDVFVDKLAGIRNMDAQTIKEAYGVEDANEVLSTLDKTLEKANTIKNHYEYWQENAPNPFNPSNYKKDTPEYADESIGYVAWEQAKNQAVFMNYSFGRTMERMNSILQDINSYKPLQKMGSNDLSILFDSQKISSNIALLQTEISALSGSTDTQSRQRLVEKQQALEVLENYYNKLASHQRGIIEDLSDTTEKGPTKEGKAYRIQEVREQSLQELKEAYRKYIQHHSSITGEPVINNKLDASFDKLKDFYSLSNDHASMANAINVLHNPEGFYEHTRRLNTILKDLYNSRADIIKKGLELTLERKDTNSLINALYDKGIIMEPEDLEAFLTDGSLPEKFYDIVNKIIIPQGNPRYKEYAAILKGFEDATQSTPAPVAETTNTDSTTTEPYKPVSTATPWDELPASLIAELTPLWEKYLSSQPDFAEKADFELDNIRQNWLTSPEALTVITNYNIEQKFKKAPSAPSAKVPSLRTKKIADGRTVDQLSIRQLYSVLDQLKKAQAVKLKPGDVDLNHDARALDIQDLEEYINYRNNLAPKDKSSIVNEIVNRIEASQSIIEGRSPDEKFYIIGGVPYRRVTSVIEPLVEEYTGDQPFEEFLNMKFQDAYGIFQMVDMSKGDVKQFMGAFRRKNYREFNERKYNALEQMLSMEDGFNIETLRKGINSLAYDEANIAGTKVDRIVRDFFDNEGKVEKPEGISESAFEALMNQLDRIQGILKDEGLTILSNKVVVYDPELKIAGELDLLVIDQEGNIFIYDIKTSTKKKWDTYDMVDPPTGNYRSSQKVKHAFQLSAYGNIIHNSYGIDSSGNRIMPIEITYNQDGFVETLTTRSVKELKYMPEVEEVIPRRDLAPKAIIVEPAPVDNSEPEPESVPTSTNNSTEQPILPNTVNQLVGKQVVWQGKLGKLVKDRDGFYLIDTGTMLYEVTKNGRLSPKTVGVTLPKIEETVLNRSVVKGITYQAKFIDSEEKSAQINGINYRVNRNKQGNIVSLTYLSNQAEIAETQELIREIKSELVNHNSQQKDLFSNPEITKSEKDIYIRKTIEIEFDLEQEEKALARLVSSQAERTTSNQDLIFTLNALPNILQSRKSKSQETQIINVIKDASVDYEDVHIIDQILEANYPEELDILLRDGVHNITVPGVERIKKWAENAITRLENQNSARKSTQLSASIEALYELLNDLENIKLNKNGSISKRQVKRLKGEPVQVGESNVVDQVPTPGSTTGSTEQVTTGQSESTTGELPIEMKAIAPLTFSYGNNQQLVGAGIKTSTSRNKNTTGLKPGESGTQSIPFKEADGTFSRVKVKVTYLGELNISQANKALESAANRRLATDSSASPDIQTRSNFEIAEAFDATTKREPTDTAGIDSFLSGNSLKHIYSLEVLNDYIETKEVVNSSKGFNIDKFTNNLAKIKTVEQYNTFKGKLFQQMSQLKSSKTPITELEFSQIEALMNTKREELGIGVVQQSASEYKPGDIVIIKDSALETYEGSPIFTVKSITKDGKQILLTQNVDEDAGSGKFDKLVSINDILGKYNINMKESVIVPSAEEKNLVKQSISTADTFLGDEDQLKIARDEADKADIKDLTNDLLNDVNCPE